VQGKGDNLFSAVMNLEPAETYPKIGERAQYRRFDVQRSEFSDLHSRTDIGHADRRQFAIVTSRSSGPVVIRLIELSIGHSHVELEVNGSIPIVPRRRVDVQVVQDNLIFKKDVEHAPSLYKRNCTR